jgi:signal transduction histidine kinase
MVFENIEVLVLGAAPKDFDLILIDLEHDQHFHIEDLRELFPKLPVVLCCENIQQTENIGKRKLDKFDEKIFTGDLSVNALEQMLVLIHSKHQSMLQQKGLKLRLSKMQAANRERDGNIVLQQNALLKLAKIKFKQEILDQSFEQIGLITLETLGIEKFSIWIMDNHLEQLKCECYITSQGYHGGEDVAALHRDDLDDYFEQLEKGHLISMDSGLMDPDIYGKDKSTCLAVIEAPLFEDGVVYGMIRFEELNEPRTWQVEELSFADAVSDMVTMAIDQWELHRIEEDHRRRENELARQLQESNVELQQFSSIVSHDLQDPLYKIDAFGELLNEICVDLEDEKAEFYIQKILNASKRMRHLILDLLAFSRVESQGHSFEEIDLNDVFKTTMVDLEIRIVETQAKITSSNLPKVKADRTQVEQLFRNILGNSLKFSKSDVKPEIKISHEIKPQKAIHLIVFEDNGIGIEDEDEQKIFGVFQRLYASKDYEGTGMGLAIVQKIAKRHGWKVSAHGALGQGTKFEVEIPIHA